MSKIEVDAKTIFEAELWEAGSGTLVFSIGKKTKEFYGFNKGDRLTIAVIKHLPARNTQLIEKGEAEAVNVEASGEEEKEREGTEQKQEVQKGRGGNSSDKIKSNKFNIS